MKHPVLSNLILQRTITTSHAVGRSHGVNKYQTRESVKRVKDDLWKKQKSMNPFYQNVGMAHQLKSLNIDKDDPTFKTEHLTEMFQEFDETLEGMNERSKAFRDQHKVDEVERKRIEKRRIIQKKVYPKPKNPSLLTWMEKEMIRYLHRMDPEEWSYERLSESFPATTSVIHKVLRAKTLTSQKMIRDYNKEVTQNWKLLSKGQLQLDEAYERHLKTEYKTLQISSGLKNLAEQEINIELEKLSNGLPKPIIPGEFAKIIIDYNNKIAKDTKDTNVTPTEVIDVPNLFADNTVPGTPMLNEVSPYGESALLATNINLRQEPRMDVEKFRKKYLTNEKTSKEEKEENPNPLREKYLSWVRAEHRKYKTAARTVPKIEQSDIEDLEREDKINRPEEEEGFEINTTESGETFVFDSARGAQHLNVKPSSPDFIEIEPQLKSKFKFFQLGDTIYDRDGYFLYRVPGLG